MTPKERIYAAESRIKELQILIKHLKKKLKWFTSNQSNFQNLYLSILYDTYNFYLFFRI